MSLCMWIFGVRDQMDVFGAWSWLYLVPAFLFGVAVLGALARLTEKGER